VAHAQKSWNGVAILSREPAQVVEKGLPDEEEMGARLISAKVGGLDFTTLYCPNGKSVGHSDFPRKLKWLDSLARYLREQHRPEEAAVLCGDFNICPTPLDTWNETGFSGEIFHTREERIRFQRLLDWGLLDAYRDLFPHERAFSWWDYRAGAFHKNQGLRIDFVLVTRPLGSEVKSAQIDRDYRKKKEGLTASDHAPVLVELSA
jgi:exodeoxyribonuclease-3